MEEGVEFLENTVREYQQKGQGEKTVFFLPAEFAPKKWLFLSIRYDVKV